MRRVLQQSAHTGNPSLRKPSPCILSCRRLSHCRAARQAPCDSENVTWLSEKRSRLAERTRRLLLLLQFRQRARAVRDLLGPICERRGAAALENSRRLQLSFHRLAARTCSRRLRGGRARPALSCWPLTLLHCASAGPVTRARLATIGVQTIGQLAKMPEYSLERLLGRAAGEKLTALAWNRDPRQIKTHHRAQSCELGARHRGHRAQLPQ